MAPAEDLAGLLRQLEGARTPLERLRRVALAWRELRRLNRDEREQLATRLGLEEAGALLERLAVRRGGLAPAELLRAVRAAQQADPGELQRLMHGLADPATRRATVIQGLAQLDERLQREGTAAVGSAEPEAAPEPELDAASGTIEEPGERGRELPPVPVSAAVPSDAVDQPEPPPLPSQPADVAPARRFVEPVPAESPGRAELGERAPSRAAPAAGPGGIEAESATAATAGLAEELAATPSLTVRLRRLRSALGSGGRLQDGGLAAVLDAFPDGWARRRALSALLEHGLPRGSAAALALIEQLGAERDRAWCLGLLARLGSSSPEEMAPALQDLASPALRRRVERLLVG